MAIRTRSFVGGAWQPVLMTGRDAASRDEARSLRVELEHLDEAIGRHQALVVIQQMEELDRVMLWYGHNAAEVLRTINSLNSGLGVLLLAQEEVPFGEDEHREYITELGRTWHNWVAAANTVADHMREQFKEQPPDLQEEYEQKKQELLAPHDVVAFISRSRNVLLHRGVFNTGVTWRFTQKSEHFEANCRTDILLNRYATWWNQGARRYIESKAPRMNLKGAVEEHAEAVLPLYEWYEDRVYQYHYPLMQDFEETAERIRQIKERLEPDSVPPPDETAHFTTPAERRSAQQRRTPPPRKAKSKSKKRRKKK